jgi:hypothetical protein
MRTVKKSLQNVPARVTLKGEDEPREVAAVVAREDGLFSLRTGRVGRPKTVAAKEIESVEAL